MSRTRILVALLVFVVLIQVFPDRAQAIKLVAVVGAVLYFLAWAIPKSVAQYKRNKAQAAQEAADAREYQLYHAELESIRAKYDPDRDLQEAASIPEEYRAALSALHDKHQAMLNRKFGPR